MIILNGVGFKRKGSRAGEKTLLEQSKGLKRKLLLVGPCPFRKTSVSGIEDASHKTGMIPMNAFLQLGKKKEKKKRSKGFGSSQKSARIHSYSMWTISP